MGLPASITVMAKIEIYTSPLCWYCHRAKHLLNKKNAQFLELSVIGSNEIRSEMVDRAGGLRTVPQIFIDGHHIGGCDDLYALEARGGLDPLLMEGR